MDSQKIESAPDETEEEREGHDRRDLPEGSGLVKPALEYGHPIHGSCQSDHEGHPVSTTASSHRRDALDQPGRSPCAPRPGQCWLATSSTSIRSCIAISVACRGTTGHGRRGTPRYRAWSGPGSMSWCPQYIMAIVIPTASSSGRQQATTEHRVNGAGDHASWRRNGVGPCE